MRRRGRVCEGTKVKVKKKKMRKSEKARERWGEREMRRVGDLETGDGETG